MLYRNKRGNLTPDKSSIVLDLKPVLAARNIKTPTAYLIKIGINNKTVTKMLKGEAVQLNFRQLTTICLNLNCTPNDILALRDMTLPPNHALHVIKLLETPHQNISDWIAGKSLEEMRQLMQQ